MLLHAFLLATISSTAATLVVPPEGPGPGSDLGWVAEAVADELSQALQQLDVAAIDRSDRLRAQEALEIPRVPLTRATSIRVAQALGATRLVVGTYSQDGASLSLALRVLDVERGTLSAPLMASGPLETLSDLIDGLAWDLALSGPTPPTISRGAFRARRERVAFAALKAYAQALGAREASARVKLMRSALRLDSGYAAARLALGRLQIEAREFEPALETFARIPAGSPLARSATFLRGVALLELGRYREAAALYDGLARQRSTAAVLNNYALALMRLEAAAPKASAILRQAVELEPDSNDLTFNMGWALFLEGDPGAAAFWLLGLTRDAVGDVHARVVLSWALRKAGKNQEAESEWQAVRALAPSYDSLSAPDLSRRFERVQVSERLLAIDREPRTDAQVAADLVASAERQAAAGDVEGTLRLLTRAVYLDPHHAGAHLLLARTYRKRGERDKAVAELRMALWSKEDAFVRAELAELLQELGQLQEARAEAEKALQQDPGNAVARRVLKELGDAASRPPDPPLAPRE